MFEFGRCWNWKTAAFSACLRASLFAAGALHGGPAGILKTALIELAITAFAAGFQGALTQKLRRSKPAWRATLLCAAAVAVVIHPAEYLLHTLARTPGTSTGIALSLAYTVIATRLSLYVMQRGLFLVGAESNSFLTDLRRLPALIAQRANLQRPFSDA